MRFALLVGFLATLSLNVFAQSLSIPPIPANRGAVGNARIEVRRGNISENGQRDTFTFTAPRDGWYRFEMAELRGGAQVRLMVWNHLDVNIGDRWAGNGQGHLVRLTGGRTYSIEVRQSSGLSPYHLVIGHQKETVDVSRLTELSDSVQFTEQRNIYTFTAPRTGRFRFEMAELRGGAQVRIVAWNRLDEVIADRWAGNGQGHTLNLIGGQTYIIEVRQSSGLSPYHLIIGHQKETVDISRITRLSDSVQYTDQSNVYTFTASRTGNHRFEIAELMGNAQVRIIIRNRLDEVIADRWVGNGHGHTLNLTGGQTYGIEIRQSTGLSSYALNIIRP